MEGRPSARDLSDLSAAYLALSATDPWLLVDALAAATQAAELAPQDPAVRFNQALVEEKLSLITSARNHWRLALMLEGDARWRDEAGERLRYLERPTTARRWEVEKPRIVASGPSLDAISADRTVREFPREIRRLLETLWLPKAANSPDDPSARTSFATVKLWADAFARRGEPLFTESVATIEKPKDADSARRQDEGLELYAEGVKVQSDCSLAEPKFERAEALLAKVGNPMHNAARIERLVCVYRRRPQDAERPFHDLVHLPYPTLASKAERMAGLCAISDGRTSEAIAHYLRATHLLADSGAPEVLYLEGMLSEAYGVLGNRSGVWIHRLAALRGAVASGDFQMRHAILFGLADELAESGRSRASRPVLAEMFANARAWGEPGAESETLLRRINLRLVEGKTDLVAEDISTFERVVRDYRQADDRSQLVAELRICDAERNIDVLSAKARDDARAVVASLSDMGEGLLLPRALLLLARAELRAGDLGAAEKAFRRTLKLYEERRAATEGENSQIEYFATAQKSFDAMIRFQAIDRRDAVAALRYVEQARVRGLREHLSLAANAATDFDPRAVLDRLPQGTAAIEFAVLPDVLLVWRLYDGSLTLYKLPISRAEVARRVSRLRSALQGARTEVEEKEARSMAADAFDRVLAPALTGVPAGTRLAFLPDRELHSLPFAALFDARRGRYVVEDYPSWVTPSLGMLTSADRLSAGRLRDPLRRALVVGEPRLVSPVFRNLFALPFAKKEAEVIAASYPERALLAGRDATRSRILAALPGTPIFHLAAHVLVDARQPLQSLVATADPEEDVLRASDLDARALAGVQLVFLAGCDTAPGFGDGDREGVAGLARAILGAGVPSLVATLWPIDDRAIEGLPQKFHDHLRAGDSPAEALRRAQIGLMSRNSLPRPLAWAPFQLYLNNSMLGGLR